MSDVDRSNNPLEVSESWGRDSTLSRDSDSRRFSMPRRDANFSGSSNASPEIAATVNPANAVAEGTWSSSATIILLILSSRTTQASREIQPGNSHQNTG